MDPVVTTYLDTHGVTDRTRGFLARDHRMYIGGEWTAAETGETRSITEPCTEGTLADVPSATPADVDRAVAAASSALASGDWAEMKPAERERMIHRLADLVEANAQTLAEIESLDAGKAIGGCRAVDIAGSIDLLRYMAGWATKIEGSTRPVSAQGEHFVYTLKEPVGVVAAVVPWNWPFNMAIWKLAAPLAAGCSVVLKPSQLTPLSMLFFAELCQEAGLPCGVVNIVTGSGSTAGARLTANPDVAKVSFTGSTEIGRTVGKSAIEHFANVTLELGGKSPMLVFADADIESVVAATQQSVFFNTGQVCSAGSRMYVERSIYEETLAGVAGRASAMKLGPTLDPECEMGPAISAHQRDSVCRYIALGQEEGARLVCGGRAPEGKGFFVEPTLLADCTNAMRVVQEEIFGPVLVALPFDDEQEAIALANDSPYGLAASIFTRDLSRAHRLIPRLQAGTVWVNTHDLVDCCTPFGGYKQSGIGRDLGPEQIAHFLQTKTVWIQV